MKDLSRLEKYIRRGEVYRREDLSHFSGAVDRELARLVQDQVMVKLRNGLYHYPRLSVFGKVPPDEKKLVSKFLKDDNFLLTSPNLYNSLGVGTTQLYNKSIVYNHKRRGAIRLGNRIFHFVDKSAFPKKLTIEFLLVDLLNNISNIAEDSSLVLNRVKERVSSMDKVKLKKSVQAYGNPRTKSFMMAIL
ncbi:DUF6088 family protein [Arcticibacter svalbardensis]|nr:DUF6088 family protein [Arcticibacter svalbardensis]